MSANQIGGFFNRLEASRKYLFGSVGVLGETNNSIITGALIARGQDVKPVVDCAPDWESYSYEKIDLSNEEQKKPHHTSSRPMTRMATRAAAAVLLRAAAVPSVGLIFAAILSVTCIGVPPPSPPRLPAPLPAPSPFLLLPPRPRHSRTRPGQ